MTKDDLIQKMAKGYMNAAFMGVYDRDGIEGALKVILNNIDEIVDYEKFSAWDKDIRIVLKPEFQKGNPNV